MKSLRIASIPFLTFLLMACGETAVSPTSSEPATATVAVLPTPTLVEPTATPSEAVAEATPAPTDTVEASAEVSAGTATAEITAEAAPVDWLAVEGKTENNLTYQGNPEAPVTLIDYSDFL